MWVAVVSAAKPFSSCFLCVSASLFLGNSDIPRLPKLSVTKSLLTVVIPPEKALGSPTFPQSLTQVLLGVPRGFYASFQMILSSSVCSRPLFSSSCWNHLDINVYARVVSPSAPQTWKSITAAITPTHLANNFYILSIGPLCVLTRLFLIANLGGSYY